MIWAFLPKLLEMLIPQGYKTIVGTFILIGAELIERLNPSILSDGNYAIAMAIGAALGGIGLAKKADRAIEAVRESKQPAAKWDDFLQP